MSAYLNASFIKSVRKRVEDCSGPVQLREYLNRYRNYVFTDAIKQVFVDRINFFKEYHEHDSLVQSQCEDLEDLLDLEFQISTACKSALIDPNNPNPELEKAYTENIDISFVDSEDFDQQCKKEQDTLIAVFKLTNGNKLDICRILDVTNEILNRKIKQYRLKPLLNEIRRDFRANLSKKLKD